MWVHDALVQLSDPVTRSQASGKWKVERERDTHSTI